MLLRTWLPKFLLVRLTISVQVITALAVAMTVQTRVVRAVQQHCTSSLCLQAALLQANGGELTTEMLSPLLRAVPEQKEITDIQLYLRVISFLVTQLLHVTPKYQL